MASIIYPKAKEKALQGALDMLNGDVRFILIDLADYTYSAAHEFLDDVPLAARVAVTAADATNKSFTNGVFDCDNSVWSAVTGDQSEAILCYLHTGVEATSQLVALIDTGTGLPVTPGGGDINITWDSGASKVFAL